MMMANRKLCLSVPARSGPGARGSLPATKLNYWTFGDYLGIGAGAHGKRTDRGSGRIERRVKIADPEAYLAAVANPAPRTDLVAEQERLSDQDLLTEFALNALRLCDGVPESLFSARTGLAPTRLGPAVARGLKLGLLTEEARLKPTALGLRFLDDLLSCFTPPR